VRAAVCAAHGPPETVRVQELPSPVPGPGEVKVRVHAAAVNFPDVLICADQYQTTAPTPFIPGSEYAGEVIEVAADVTRYAVGDHVFGGGFVGAFAEEIVAAEASLNRVPPGVGLRVAAAFGVAHRTAYHVLRAVSHMQAGDELVVLGAGGGVGLAAVQLGATLGATVTAVASSEEKLAVAEQEGASRLINHKLVDLRQALKDAIPGGGDVVVDPVGGSLSEPALRCLRWGGRFVTVGYASGEIPRIPLNLVLLKGVVILGYGSRNSDPEAREEMARNDLELMELLAAGRATPYIGASFSLSESAAALRYVADGRAIGKVVLDVD
jgi:NADPH:quinone reductase